MDRRRFLLLSGTAAAAATGSPTPRASAQDAAAPASPPAGRMKVGCQRFGSKPDRLGYLRRCGVEAICISPAAAGPDGLWTAETCAAAKARVEEAGLGVASMFWGVPIDVLVPERRDKAIDACRRQIETAGRGGIPVLAYNLHVRIWKARTHTVPGRAGCAYSAWDLSKVEPQKKPDIGPVDADAMWARIAYFLERVVPVAAEFKVRLACHPPDPPMPAEHRWKIAQVMDTVEGLKRFVSLCDSPYHGLTFCQGSVCEMMQDPRREIFDAIRWFGTRRKIFQVHFRNLRGGRDRFVETFPDDGDVDMAQAARVYREVGYDGVLMPDHIPGHPDDPEGLQNWAFAYGYIKGLIEAVYGA
jgi:mannonate dehydratase